MKKVYVFLAEGFEEIEAVTPIDVLRRAGVEVTTVGVTGKTVTGSHGIPFVADVAGEGFALPPDADMVVLPGGGPGYINLGKSDMVKKALADAAARDLYIAAICAAPTVLEAQGLLSGKRVTGFPEVLGDLKSAGEATGSPVEVDGKLITGRSAGVALRFAQTLAEALVGREQALEVVGNLYP